MTFRDGGDELAGVFRGVEAVSRDSTRAGITVAETRTLVLGDELAALAENDERIVVATADLASANRTREFAERHPGRFFNFGIAEKNMVTACAGMAACGFVPYAVTFASFLALLCAEQIRTDCAYPYLPVRLVGTHSGMSMGFYGTSHHALEDIAMMRSIADLKVVSAADANQLRAILRKSVDEEGPIYVRTSRGRDPEVYSAPPDDLVFGGTSVLRNGSDIALLATGSTVAPAVAAADLLARDGISARVIDVYSLSPLDEETIRAAAEETGVVLAVEEHNVTGGLGSAVAEVLAGGPPVTFVRHGIPDEHVPIGPPTALYAHYRLDADGIAGVSRELLEGLRSPAR